MSIFSKKVAVVLSGCGVYDGSEIHEAAACMAAISRHNAEPVVFAPKMDQVPIHFDQIKFDLIHSDQIKFDLIYSDQIKFALINFWYSLVWSIPN